MGRLGGPLSLPLFLVWVREIALAFLSPLTWSLPWDFDLAYALIAGVRFMLYLTCYAHALAPILVAPYLLVASLACSAACAAAHCYF